MQKFMIKVLLVSGLMIQLTSAFNSNNEVGGEREVFKQPPVMRGVSGKDCAKDECSVVGMQRYSEPHCAPLRKEGENCILGAESENKTLGYPDKVLECSDVYTLMCPCAKGLICRAGKCARSNRWNGKLVMNSF